MVAIKSIRVYTSDWDGNNNEARAHVTILNGAKNRHNCEISMIMSGNHVGEVINHKDLDRIISDMGHTEIPEEDLQKLIGEISQLNDEGKIEQYKAIDAEISKLNGRAYETPGNHDLCSVQRFKNVESIDGKMVTVSGVKHFGIEYNNNKGDYPTLEPRTNDDLNEKAIEENIRKLNGGIVVSYNGFHEGFAPNDRKKGIQEAIDKHGASFHCGHKRGAFFKKLNNERYGMRSCSSSEDSGSFYVVRDDTYEYVYTIKREKLMALANALNPGDYSINSSIIRRQQAALKPQTANNQETEKKAIERIMKKDPETFNTTHGYIQDYMKEKNINRAEIDKEDLAHYLQERDSETFEKYVKLQS